jgi:hypothetical protein
MPRSTRVNDELYCGHSVREIDRVLMCKTYLRTVAAAVVETVQAPPAMTFLHAEQFQMPTAERLTLSCNPFSSIRYMFVELESVCIEGVAHDEKIDIPCHRRYRCNGRVG